jgi:hypothetical protein
MDPSRSRLFSSREGKKSKEETEKGTGQVKAGFASYQPEITRYTGAALSRRPETRTYQKIHFTDGEKPRGRFFFCNYLHRDLPMEEKHVHRRFQCYNIQCGKKVQNGSRITQLIDYFGGRGSGWVVSMPTSYSSCCQENIASRSSTSSGLLGS